VDRKIKKAFWEGVVVRKKGGNRDEIVAKLHDVIGLTGNIEILFTGGKDEKI
jgi:hypothetical protein